MTRILSALFALTLFLAALPSFAKTSATGTFIAVQGTVTLKSQTGHQGRLVKLGDKVVQGQRVITDKDGSAVIQFFDGSQLGVKPNTDFWLSKLEKPSDQDKIMKFKMLLGQLIAKVTKLASTNSAFEIEAGGVVCGVRGTQFSMNFDPGSNKVILDVLEGTVYSHSHGQSHDFGAGSQGVFLDGKWLSNLKPPGPTNDPALDDLSRQFQTNVNVNHDNGQNDPSVGGSASLRISVNVPPGENVP